MIRRLLIAAALVLPLADSPASAEGPRFDECTYNNINATSWTTREVRLTIRCAFLKWRAPGGVDKALSVAQCESGLNERAYNPGGYAGLFQQAVEYWPDRFHTVPGWDRELSTSIYNARSNAVVSARMATGGWSAWSCA